MNPQLEGGNYRIGLDVSKHKSTALESGIGNVGVDGPCSTRSDHRTKELVVCWNIDPEGSLKIRKQHLFVRVLLELRRFAKKFSKLNAFKAVTLFSTIVHCLFGSALRNYCRGFSSAVRFFKSGGLANQLIHGVNLLLVKPKLYSRRCSSLR